MMSWLMAAQFGMQLLGGMNAAKQQRAQAEAQGIIDQANADAANKNRDSQNRVNAAVSSLNSYTRSLNNKRAGEAGGAKINALRTNVQRAMDQMSQGSTQAQLQASEQMGAVSAMASAAGVGGSSVDTVKRTMQLRRGMQEEQMNRVVKATQVDFEASQSAAIGELFGSQDVATSVASMDYGVSQPPVRHMGSTIASTLFNPRLDWTLLRDGLFRQDKGDGFDWGLDAPAATVDTSSYGTDWL